MLKSKKIGIPSCKKFLYDHCYDIMSVEMQFNHFWAGNPLSLIWAVAQTIYLGEGYWKNLDINGRATDIEESLLDQSGADKKAFEVKLPHQG